jgi:hypothetical protein
MRERQRWLVRIYLGGEDSDEIDKVGERRTSILKLECHITQRILLLEQLLREKPERAHTENPDNG